MAKNGSLLRVAESEWCYVITSPAHVVAVMGRVRPTPAPTPQLLSAGHLPGSNHRVAQRARAGGYYFPTARLAFIHIGKTGGESFARMVNTGAGGKQLPPLKSCNPYMSTQCASYRRPCIVGHDPAAVRPGHDDARYKGCNMVISQGASMSTSRPTMKMMAGTKSMTIVRNPIFHVRSMWMHCQQVGANGARLHRYSPISFKDWVMNFSAFGSKDAAETSFFKPRKYCDFDPRNPQARALGDDAEDAMRHVEQAVWVGVIEEFTASLCVLRAVLAARPELAEGTNTSWPEPFACSCEATSPSGGSTAHATHGTHPENTQMSGKVLAAVGSMTRLDQLVHATAMARLGRELQALNLTCLLQKSNTRRPTHDTATN